MARYPDARVAYQAAADLNPESASAWLLVAQAAMLAGDSGRAVQSARRASQLEPSSVDAAMMLGYATLRSGQADVAITALVTVNTAHPRDTLIWCLLGRCYAAAGKASDALRCYNEALKVDPVNKLALELVATMKAADNPKVN